MATTQSTEVMRLPWLALFILQAEGGTAYEEGAELSDNPYYCGSPSGAAWRMGWLDAAGLVEHAVTNAAGFTPTTAHRDGLVRLVLDITDPATLHSPTSAAVALAIIRVQATLADYEAAHRLGRP